jgi:HK97 family phage major capsid protein
MEAKAGLADTVQVLQAGVGSAGGYLAPAETERLVERRLMVSSPMRGIASVRTIGAGVFRKPVSMGGVETGWVAETQPRPETDASTLALLEFPSAELYANPAATQTLLDDAFVNLDEWLAGEIEDAFVAQETAAFTSGDGVNKPKGFLSYDKQAGGGDVWGKIGYLATGEAGGFGPNPYDALITLVYQPRTQFRPNARFVMNRQTVQALRKEKDADGKYIWQPAAAPGQQASLLGYPVVELETMPDMADGSFSVAFGDFAKGYLIVDRAGLRVLRDPYSAKPYVLFYTTKRVGGGVQNFDAIKLLKFGAS